MKTDITLVQIVDAAMAEAARRSGAWLACRPGCCQCCIGPFPITQLDAARLRAGLAGLFRADPERAGRVRRRAEAWVERMRREFPVDPVTGVLEGEALDEEACPALDPDSGTCDLYGARPITCRTFGPAVRLDGEALGVCELCYHGATDDEIAACRVEVDPEGLEAGLVQELESATGRTGDTVVAFGLLGIEEG